MKSRLLPLFGILFLTLNLDAGAVAAPDAGCDPVVDACVETGTWDVQIGIGAGLRSNPVRDSGDIPLILVPQISYYGERFFVENLEFGYTLTESPRWIVNAIVTPGRDSGFFLGDDPGNFFIDGLTTVLGPGEGLADTTDPDSPLEAIETDFDIDNLHNRRIAVLAGLEISASLGAAHWQFQVLQDISDAHNGQELRLAVGTGMQYGKQQFSAAAGVTWKSDKLLNYYYGVREAEAGAPQFVYQPDSGLTPFLRLGWQRELNHRWRLLASVQYEFLSSQIHDSPIVDKDYVAQIFVGGMYRF